MNLIVVATVIYVLLAIAMIVLILMQRGAGAQAGSGFGAGASATVFGASGSSNFLSKTTKWLAVLFFALSLGMAWYASRHGGRLMPAEIDSVGLMAGSTEAPAAEALPSAPAATPPAPSEVPASALPAPAAPPAGEAPSQNPPQSPPAGERGG